MDQLTIPQGSKHYEKMPIVRTFKFDNLALQKSANGFENAKGQYILRLDGDFLDPNALLPIG